MSHYTHLTTDEREHAMIMLTEGFSFRAIARKLKRSPSTISREIKRNAKKNGEYSANHAQELCHHRRKECGPSYIFADPEAAEYVIQRIKMKWTPEQIAGRAKSEKYHTTFSFVTIYRAIAHRVLPISLHREMRFKSKRKSHKPYDKRGKIQDTISIRERPSFVENRKSIGHWESDTVLGQRKTGVIGTHVERKTGFLIAFKLDDRTDNAFNRATIAALSTIPPKYKKSLTVDHGTEFIHHKDLATQTNMKIYFCDTYSPWQRGTNENTNGLLRQFFPKGTSFYSITQESLDYVVSLINNRPRKRLGWRSPQEVFLENFYS